MRTGRPGAAFERVPMHVRRRAAQLARHLRTRWIREGDSRELDLAHARVRPQQHRDTLLTLRRLDQRKHTVARSSRTHEVRIRRGHAHEAAADEDRVQCERREIAHADRIGEH